MPNLETEEAPVRVDRRAAWASAAAAAVLLAVTAWFGWNAANAPVRWRDVGFQLEPPSGATATYDVFLYSEAGAVCRVHALNSRHAVVGYTDHVVSRADGSNQRVTTHVVTTETAVTAFVAYCEAA